MRWALIEAVQRQPAGSRPRQVKDAIIARRGTQARNIAKVAAARKLLTYVFYAMRDGHVRSLDTPAAPVIGGALAVTSYERFLRKGNAPSTSTPASDVPESG
jgi:hypothetical protein